MAHLDEISCAQFYIIGQGAGALDTQSAHFRIPVNGVQMRTFR